MCQNVRINDFQICCFPIWVVFNSFYYIQPYPEDPAVYKPLSQEELQRIKNEKKQKQNERKQKISENRKHLASVRVVQKNLVFVVGLSQRLADPEVSTSYLQILLLTCLSRNQTHRCPSALVCVQWILNEAAFKRLPDAD